MKKASKIPISKIQRASKLVTTGAKVGVNYLKYYGNKITETEEEAREKLNKSNAEDIYDSLKDLKGSPLKVAQMLSMEKSILPRAYVEKFSLAQFSVPPLSEALVSKTFKKSFGKFPSEIYDSFDLKAYNAASIGQVHKAEKNGKKLAVKIQYPGVSDSIKSDLALLKPFVIRMFNMKGKMSDEYFLEVQDKLLEETDYVLEVQQSQEIVDAVVSAGANSVAIHARTKRDGYNPPAYWEKIPPIIKDKNIAVVANGEIWQVEDAMLCQKRSGCTDLMLGRGALSHPDLAKKIKAHVNNEQYDSLEWEHIIYHLIHSAIHQDPAKDEKYFA